MLLLDILNASNPNNWLYLSTNNRNTREEFPNNMDTSLAKIISMLNRISEGVISI